MNISQLLAEINFITTSIPLKSCVIEDFMESIFVQNQRETDHINKVIYSGDRTINRHGKQSKVKAANINISFCLSVFSVCQCEAHTINENLSKKDGFIIRRPNLFFKCFYILIGPG